MATHKWVKVAEGRLRRVKVLRGKELQEAKAKAVRSRSLRAKERIGTFSTPITMEHAWKKPRTFANQKLAQRALKADGMLGLNLAD